GPHMTTSEAGARQAASGPARPQFGDRYVIAADRVFDGTRVLEGHAVAVSQDKITAVTPAERQPGSEERIRFAGTLLPRLHRAARSPAAPASSGPQRPASPGPPR